MVIYLPNEHVEPLLRYLKRGPAEGGELNALTSLMQQIDAGKKEVPFRLWQERQATYKPEPRRTKPRCTKPKPRRTRKR